MSCLGHPVLIYAYPVQQMALLTIGLFTEGEKSSCKQTWENSVSFYLLSREGRRPSDHVHSWGLKAVFWSPLEKRSAQAITKQAWQDLVFYTPVKMDGPQDRYVFFFYNVRCLSVLGSWFFKACLVEWLIDC